MRKFMSIWLERLKEMSNDDDGAVAVEYAMIAGTVTLAIAFAVSDIGNSLTTIYQSFSGGF